MHAGRIIARIELFQRLVLMLMLGVIPLVVDPDVLASFVDTKYLMIELLIMFMLFTSAIKLALGGLRDKVSWAMLPLLLLLLVYVGHVFTDPQPRFALLGMLKYGLYLLLPMFYLSAFKTRHQQAKAEAFFVLMTVPMLIYGIAQFLNFELFEYTFEAKKSSVQGTLGNSHFLGGYLAMFVFILVNRIRQTRSGQAQLLYIFSLVIVAFLLIVSKSRGAMLCMAAAAFGYWGVRAWCGWNENRTLVWKGVLAAWLITGLMIPTVFWYGGRKAETHPIRKIELKFHRDRSFNNRIILGLASIEMWNQKPVWGVGLDRYPIEFFQALYNITDRPDAQLVKNLVQRMESTQANEAHNDFLHTLAETGAVGFILLAGICCTFLAGLGRLLRHRTLKIERGDLILVGCLLPGLLTIVAQMNYSFPLHLPANASLVFFFFGWSAVLFRRYGVLESPRPRWMHAGGFRWIVAILMILFSAWGSITVLRQYIGLVFLRRGYIILEQTQNATWAMDDFRQAGILYPENGEIAFCKAQVYAMDNDQLRKALDMLDDANQTFTNSSIRLVRSQLYLEMFRFTEALRVLEPLSVVTKRLEKLHLARGMVYYHDSNFDQAIKEFEAELEINPRSQNALLYLAQSHFELEHYYQAAELFHRAYRRQIKSIEVAERLGDIYCEHQFRPKKARMFYSQAMTWAIETKRGQDIRRLERKIEKLEKKIRLKMENPRFRLMMQSK